MESDPYCALTAGRKNVQREVPGKWYKETGNVLIVEKKSPNFHSVLLRISKYRAEIVGEAKTRN